MGTFPIGAGHGLLSCPAGSGLMPGLYSKGATAVTAAVKGGCVVRGVPAALGGPGPGMVAGAGKTMAAKGLAAGGLIAGGKGLSLGLGIGLGLAGPAILAGLGVVAGYTLWRSRSAVDALNENDVELGEALSER